MLEQAGYRRVRTFVEMRADLSVLPPSPSLPDDLVRTPFEDRYDALTLDARNATFAGHWGSTEEPLASWRHQMTGSKDFRADLSFLLLTPERDRVQAFVLSAFQLADAEGTGVRELYVHYIGTRAEARGRGLASALLAYTLQEARKAGFERSALSVDVENDHGALSVYERFGFQVAESTYSYVLPLN